MKRFNLFLLAAMVLAFAACTPSENNTPKELTGISLNKKTIEIEVGDTYQLRVIYEPEEAEDTAPAIVWESTKTKFASVSDNGKVEAKAAGTATITATCGKFTAECEVKVLKKGETPIDPVDPVDPSEITLNVSPESINSPSAGTTVTLEVEASQDWTVATDADWITLTPEDGFQDGSVEAVIAPATETQTTTANIVFTSHSKKVTVPVTRAGQAVSFSLSTNQVVSKYTGETLTIEVDASHPWTAQYPSDWLSFQPVSGKAGKTTAYLTVRRSYLYEQTEAEIVFTSEGNTYTLHIVRHGQPYFTVSNS
ncbi:MAG: BACON domain-containing protein [Paludibacteraceae bacterium]|nr:BACON domain-containing protein [Paludibacteraceae bacterium]